MGFSRISREAIDASLEDATRQYLVGMLARPQLLEHIESGDVEIGISRYPTYAWEHAHSHRTATEYQLVLEGMTEYLDLDSRHVHRFVAGDFYAIAPGTRYAQRVKQRTKIVFVKFPGGDDKVSEAMDEDVLAWAKAPLRVDRLDARGRDAPPANSVVPAAAAAVIDDAGDLLVLRRRDSGTWAMPGGAVEMRESMAECVVREVREEAGIDVRIEGIIGTYTDPSTRVAYSDGEVRREFTILFLARPLTQRLAMDDESTDARWVSMEAAETLSMSESQRRRVRDVRDYLIDGAVHIR